MKIDVCLVTKNDVRARNQDGVVMSKKCPILPNYYTDNNGKCVRYFVCSMQGRTKDPRCPAKGQR